MANILGLAYPVIDLYQAIIIMNKLRQNTLFSGLTDEQFSIVTATVKKLHLEEGQVLFHQQKTAEYFYFLETGDIKLYRLSADGAEKVIELIRSGQTFAEAVMFMHGKNYPVNAQALSECQLIRIEMKTFMTVLESSSETSMKILGHMSQKLHGLVQEIEQLTVQNAKMRVIQYLLRDVPKDAKTPYQVDWEMPKTVLASRVSVRPETFSRILQQLSQEKLISVNNKTVQLLNITKLRNY